MAKADGGAGAKELQENGEILEKLGLAGDLHGVARTCFDKLCSKGCESRTLAELIKQWRVLRGPLLVNGREIHLNPGDSWEAALDGFRPKNISDFGRDIHRHEEELRQLLITLTALHRTRLVKGLATSAHGDAMLKTPILVSTAIEALIEALERYRTTVVPRILEASHKVGPKRSPDRTRREHRLCGYVFQATGEHLYEDIAHILQALEPTAKLTAQSLKQSEHRAKGRNRKSPK